MAACAASLSSPRPTSGLMQSLTIYFSFAVLAWIAPFSEGQATTCTTLPGLAISTSPLDGFSDVNSPNASACCALCLTVPQCGSFMWRSDKRCSLAAPLEPSLYEDAEAISGIKTAAILSTPASLQYSEFVTAGPIHLRESALYAYSTMVLTYDSYQTGLALLLSPVQLLRDVGSLCQAASFSVAFSFQIYHSPIQPPADGFTFFMAASDIPLGSLGSVDDPQGTSRYQGFATDYDDVVRRPGAMAIEFDTFNDTASRDPDGSHVGLNLDYSPRSLVTASTLPSQIQLDDYRMKYTWIDYDAPSGTLRVYLSYTPSKPAKPLLSSALNLCRTLRPARCSSCATTTTAYVGFSGATNGDYRQTTQIFSWSLQTSWPATQPGTAPLASKCSSMTGCRFTDFQLDRFGALSSPSPSDCCAKCSSQPKCLAYTWRPTKKTCYLKTAGDSIVQDASAAKFSCGERARVIATTPTSITLADFNKSAPMFLLGSSTYVHSNIKLTYAENQVGLALHQQPVQLLRDNNSQCEAASFNATFSFLLHEEVGYEYEPVSGWGDGFTFVALASNLRWGALGGGSGDGSRLGFHLDTDEAVPGALAIEFDNNPNDDLGSLELKTDHVGIDTRYSPRSLAAQPTSKVGVSLRDSRVKYAWVDYDAKSITLSVFLGYSSVKPKTAVLSYKIDMCKVLRPADCLQACSSITTAFIGFTASTSSDKYQYTEILTFQFRSIWP